MSGPLGAVARDAGGLLVAEMFGPTLQGEGPSAGQVAVFIRLSRCNLTCSWCDTPYTWDWTRYDPRAEARRVPPEDVVAWALERAAPLVIVTGGEPLLQQDALVPVVRELVRAGRRVEVETNGTIPPAAGLVEAVSRFNVSPKLASAGGAPARRIDAATLRAFTASGKAVFKFVVTAGSDLEEIAALQERFALDPVWVMPEATSAAAVLAGLRDLADPAIAHGWNLSTRLHVLVWCDQRGH